jgi:bifunctional UDP-N-acetylglucosamine pyrophosphorylase/glucosamine-1-phosphate N-acetyltransferase
MHKVSIIILAGGSGTRMKSSLPKVLHTISGKPMLYYVVNEAKKISDDIHVVLYHQAQKVQNEIEKYFDNLKFHIQDHKNYPGTGGAVRNIQPTHNKTLVLNGDMPLIEANELKNLITNAPLTMSILDLNNANGYGRVIIDNDKVTKIVEQKDCKDDELQITTANAGIYCFDTNFLTKNITRLSNNNAQKEYYITDLVEIAVKNNLIVKPIFVKEENFKGVNSKYDLANAQIIHQNRIKKSFMQNGVIMKLPDTIFIDNDVKIEGETILENGVTILGKSIIINSHIKANSIIEDGYIENSSIGPIARIRPQSYIKSSHIGNFVEIKKSKLFDTKAGHLAYLGDCKIDSGTNIGAGTITCNYDGKNKYQTIIGKNVFVGSDTQLIAPITLEDNCIIGAGSTITKDVKSGELVLTRTKPKTIKDYFYKFFKKEI